MKKMLIACALVASLVMPQAMANEGSGGDMHVVTVANLNLRSSAVVSNNVLGVLHMGDKVTVKSTSFGGLWCKVRAEATGWEGYVACRYLNVKAAMPATPSGWMAIDGERTVGIKLNVRSTAAVANNRIGYLNTWDKVWVKAKSANGLWCKIAFERNGRTEGYVACRYLMK